MSEAFICSYLKVAKINQIDDDVLNKLFTFISRQIFPSHHSYKCLVWYYLQPLTTIVQTQRTYIFSVGNFLLLDLFCLSREGEKVIYHYFYG